MPETDRLYHTKTNCFQYNIKSVTAYWVSSSEEYNNARVQPLENTFENQNMVLIDKEANHQRRSAVLIENGFTKGMLLRFKLSNQQHRNN
jgi:hypothetical protein